MRKSLIGRWMLGTAGVVSALLAVLAAVCFLLIRAAYYRSAEDKLALKALASAELLRTYMEDMSLGVEAAGRELAEQFDRKDQMELQIIGRDGTVLLSSTGFLPQDVSAAEFGQQRSGEYALRHWKTSSGEHVMAVSVPIRDAAGLLAGGTRCVVSLEKLRQQLRQILLWLAAGALLVACAVTLITALFLRNLTAPLHELETAARRMALGDYQYRIVKHSDDEIGRLTDTINYMASELSEGEKAKNEFLTSVSHELRTPLTAIQGWSETLRQSGASDEETLLKGMEVIENESERLSGLVEQLLDFSRMQSRDFTLKKQKIDLLAELEEVVFLMRDRARREGIDLEYVESPGAPPMVADPARLRQVFVNLIDNAIKYSDAGGRIRVEAARIGRQIQIVVSDTGRGISPKDLPRVKERFFRVDHSTPGSGVGLAVADEIVTAHGGRMKIESTLGVGTTVTVTLPLSGSR